LDRAVKLEGMLVQAGERDERERVIDENLKRVYEETLDEGIPDRFKDLLNQLKQQDSEQGSSK
jgi:hypothetical protein